MLHLFWGWQQWVGSLQGYSRVQEQGRIQRRSRQPQAAPHRPSPPRCTKPGHFLLEKTHIPGQFGRQTRCSVPIPPLWWAAALPLQDSFQPQLPLHAWVVWVYLKRKRDSPRRRQSRSPTWQHAALEPRCLLSACYLERAPNRCGNPWANSFGPICTGVHATFKEIGTVHWATTCSYQARWLKSTVDTSSHITSAIEVLLIWSRQGSAHPGRFLVVFSGDFVCKDFDSMPSAISKKGSKLNLSWFTCWDKGVVSLDNLLQTDWRGVAFDAKHSSWAQG